MQGEVGAQSGLAKGVLAQPVVYHGQRHLLQQVLEVTQVSEGVLAPARSLAVASCEFGEAVRQTYGGNVGTGKGDKKKSNWEQKRIENKKSPRNEAELNKNRTSERNQTKSRLDVLLKRLTWPRGRRGR